MAAFVESGEQAGREASALYRNVTCPFCGIHCDDLEVGRTDGALQVRRNGCPKANPNFERQLPRAGPAVRGNPASLEEAIRAAADLIREARLPLFGGLATDVDGMRAAMALADRAGGVVDHALSGALAHNVTVLQTSGWITSTLTEARNRADLFIIVGSDVHRLHPRFFERVVCADESMFDTVPQKRTVVFLGQGLDTSGATGTRIGEVIALPCPLDQVGEVLAALRAVLRGTRLNVPEIAGVPLSEIEALAQRCRAASYGVMVWAPPGLASAEADLTVQLVCDIVRDLNQTQRFAGLSLGGSEGAATASSVATWQSGFPLRTSYASGRPDYDPVRYAIPHLLAEGHGDVLVWLASFTTELPPPETDVPTIVLGTPGLPLPRPPAVFIPVGTPGLDHAGRIIRCDGVVSLPLRDLKRAALPRAADVLAAIEQAL
jgi:formylmethanofuran dehydrogenase subunit B